jgi:hypothetical protein
VTLVIVFIGAICDYYFGAVGAVLGASVGIASLSKPKADLVFPCLLLVGMSWAAGQLLAGGLGALIGVASATALALWIENGGRPVAAGGRRYHMSSRNGTRR